MRQDAWRTYLEMVLGLTESSRNKAMKVAKKLVGKGGLTAEQLQTLADELVKASVANREALANLIRIELDRALERVGLARVEDVASLQSRVRDLETELARRGDGAAAPPAAEPAPTPEPGPEPAAPVPAPATQPVAKKAVAKKAVAKKTVAKKAVAKKTAEPATKATKASKATKTAKAGEDRS